MDVEDLLGLQTGDAHIIRNAGGVVTDDALRCLIISHHLLNTDEILVIHHTRCGMLAFSDDLLKAGLEGDPAAEELLGQATGRKFTSCNCSSGTPDQFHAFRGPLEALDAPMQWQHPKFIFVFLRIRVLLQHVPNNLHRTRFSYTSIMQGQVTIIIAFLQCLWVFRSQVHNNIK